MVYFHQNDPLWSVTSDCRTLLRELTLCPTQCHELVAGWADFVGVINASSHGINGIIIGELSACWPMVFRLQWPPDITANVHSDSNPKGKITNSDLELVGLVLLWLMMEHVCGLLTEKWLPYLATTAPL